MQPIPQEWIDTLKKVQEVFPQAIIAGGALRDLQYNREVKDVDIFIPIQRTEDSWASEVNVLAAIQKIENMFDTVVMPTIPVYFKESTEDFIKAGRLLETVQNTSIGETKYEIIIGTPESCDIEKFDFSICQISFDGVNLRSTNAYKRTLATNMIEFNKDWRTPTRAKERIARMKAKFPDLQMDV